MKDALKHAGRAAAGMLPAALLVRLGLPALASLVFLATLGIGVTCWIISDPARSDRVSRMMLATAATPDALSRGPPARHLRFPGLAQWEVAHHFGAHMPGRRCAG